MTLIWTIFFILMGSLLVWHFATLKFLNPYTMDLYIANKGAGKSTQLAKNAIKAIKRGETVYTNANDLKVNDVEIFNTYDLGYYYLSDAFVAVDEISLFFDNRQHAKTAPEFVEWLREIRHDRLKVDLYSQSYDCDKKIRTMCDNIYIGTKFMRVLTVWRRLRKNVAIKDSAMDAQSQIVDALAFTPWWQPGSIKITYIPKYIKYFDSFKPLKQYKGIIQTTTVNDGYSVRTHRKRSRNAL